MPGRHELDAQRARVHALPQRLVGVALADLDADERRAGLAVVALDVLEQHDVVVRAEHLVEEAPQRARLLGELHEEVVLQPPVHERALDHLGVAAHVVVAAREQADDVGVGVEVEVVERGGGQRARGLGDDAVGLVEVEHLGAHPALVHRAQLHARVPHQREGGLAHPAHGGAVDERVELRERHRLTRRHRRRHARGARGLHADHPDAGVRGAQPGRDARGQPTAADRHHDDVGRPAQLLDDLNADRALARDRAEVVERGHDRGAGVLGVLRGGRGGVVVRVALDDQLHPLAAERADPLALLPGRGGGHVHPAAHAEAAARVRHALAVVARAGADGARRPLGRVEARDQVVGAAQLVGAADLQVLALEPDPRAGGVRQPFARLQRGGDGDARELRRRALDECGQVHAPDDPRCGRAAGGGVSGCAAASRRGPARPGRAPAGRAGGGSARPARAR